MPITPSFVSETHAIPKTGAEETLALIEIQKLAFAYPLARATGQIQVIADISVRIHRGEFVCFVGPSGCGKTTLLRVIAGLLTATEGNVSITQPGSRVGYVFQTANLLPWLTALENVTLPLRVGDNLPQKSAQVDQLGRSLLDRLGLLKYEQFYPWELSVGMQMRVNLGRALITQPNILLLDEPFAALDIVTALRLERDVLLLAQERHVTCVLVTHDILDAVAMSDRILLLSQIPSTVVGEYVVDISRDGTNPRVFTPDVDAIAQKIIRDMQIHEFH